MKKTMTIFTWFKGVPLYSKSTFPHNLNKNLDIPSSFSFLKNHFSKTLLNEKISNFYFLFSHNFSTSSSWKSLSFKQINSKFIENGTLILKYFINSILPFHLPFNLRPIFNFLSLNHPISSSFSYFFWILGMYFFIHLTLPFTLSIPCFYKKISFFSSKINTFFHQFFINFSNKKWLIFFEKTVLFKNFLEKNH